MVVVREGDDVGDGAELRTVVQEESVGFPVSGQVAGSERWEMLSPLTVVCASAVTWSSVSTARGTS